MGRPVSYNVNVKPLEKDISIANMPEGIRVKDFLLLSSAM
jgi:hypothetical protein